jgi:hypothetical protein
MLVDLLRSFGMGIWKRGTVYKNTQAAPFRLEGVHPPWEMHPDWIQAIKALESYNLWVCEVVMPIAFQWIEEHKKEVYDGLPPDQHDDVGVVIAKAFQLVKEQAYYREGGKLTQDFEAELKSDKFDPATINPMWQRMSPDLDKARESVKAGFREIFRDTIR